MSYSVHYDENNIRFKTAKKQATKKPVPIGFVISKVNEFLESNGMKRIENPRMNLSEIDYARIQKEYNLNDKRDIVWMKFTKDGYLGVVATSDDISYDIPNNKEDYNKKRENGKWEFSTSGIIVHHLKKEWDESFVLVFPLVNIPDGKKRGDIEKDIGNYLISEGVPILDFYSHNY